MFRVVASLAARFLAVSVLVALPCAAAHAGTESQAAPSPGLTPVFVNGTEGYRCFRIPAIVRTPGGALLAFAEARRNSCADFGDVRIVMRRSRDDGKTWSRLETVATNGSLQADNAAPVVDLLDPRYPHGRVFLFYSTGDAPESDIIQGKGTRRVFYRTSINNGASWTAPIEITGSVKLPGWRGYATGPGHALQLTEGPHRGRIIVPAYHSEGAPQPHGRSYEAGTFFSDDHGATWHLGATVKYPGTNESTAAQNEAGDVVLNSRDESGSHARVISISHDGSQHWDTTFVAKDLPDPTCEGSMIRYARSYLLFSNPGNLRERKDLTISVSQDGGRTWPHHTVVHAGPSAYSDIVLLPHHRLGILFEQGNTGGIFFLARPIPSLL